MTNIPPVTQPTLPTIQTNTAQILLGLLATALATIVGTRATTGSAVGTQVEAVRNQASEIQQELLRLSGENKNLNIEIRNMSSDNKRLNELAIEQAKAAENRQLQIIKLLEGKK